MFLLGPLSCYFCGPIVLLPTLNNCARRVLVRSIRIKNIPGRSAVLPYRVIFRDKDPARARTRRRRVNFNNPCLRSSRYLRHATRTNDLLRMEHRVRQVKGVVFRRVRPYLGNGLISQPKRAINARAIRRIKNTNSVSRSRAKGNVALNRKIRRRSIKGLHDLNDERGQARNRGLMKLISSRASLQVVASGYYRVFLLRGHSNEIVKVTRPRRTRLFQRTVPLTLHEGPMRKDSPVTIRTTNVNVFARDKLRGNNIYPTRDLYNGVSNFNDSIHRTRYLNEGAITTNGTNLGHMELQFKVITSTIGPNARVHLRNERICPTMGIQTRIYHGKATMFVKVISISFGRNSLSVFNEWTTN